MTTDPGDADRPDADRPATARSTQKAQRRAQLLAVATELIARRGFHGVRLEDIGAGAGISGPAVYRHFPSKDAVLEELLVGISEDLLAGGEEVERAAASPADACASLVDFHVAFATERTDLIRIQDRDFSALHVETRTRVRTLQRAYRDIWARAIERLVPALDTQRSGVRAQLVIGLINSTPHLSSTVDRAMTTAELKRLATAAMLAPTGDAPP